MINTKIEMEKEVSQSVIFNDVPNENSIEPNECNERKMHENKDNFIYYVHKKIKLNNADLPFSLPSNLNDSDDSDKSSIDLLDKERIIWRRQNFNDTMNETIKRNIKEQMTNQSPVINRLIDVIEENEFLLGNMIETTYNFIKGNCLVFDKNKSEREWNDDNVNWKRFSEVKESLDKINKKFLDIDDKWEVTSKKEDLLVMHEDIATLRKQVLDVVKQKDYIIDQLVEELDKLTIKSLDEASINSNDLIKLNEVTKNKIKYFEENHKMNKLDITKIIEDETNKKIDKDSVKWNLMMDKIITKISNSAINHMKSIEQKDEKLIKKFKVLGNEDFLCMNINKKYNDIDFELLKMKCSENVGRLQHNCYILKKRIEENYSTIIDQRRQTFSLLEFIHKTKEKCQKIKNDDEIQISIIKKEIININKRIDNQKKKANIIAKADNVLYMKLWDLQQNEILQSINNVHEIDNVLHEYLGISKPPVLLEKPANETLSLLKHNINNLVFYSPPQKNVASNSYEYLRDNALNQLLLDCIVKNLSLVLDYNLNEILDSNLLHSLPYVYNALSALKLNKETWNLLKFKCKSLVICVDCNSQINWETDEKIQNSDNVEQKTCTNIFSDNCNNKFELSKDLFEKSCTRVTQHSENINKIKKSDSIYKLNDTINSNSSGFENIVDEERQCEYSSVVTYNEEPLNYTQCRNVNHKLSIINDKCFVSLIKETIKESRSKSNSKPKLDRRSQKENNYLQYKLNENDLRTKWLELMKYLPSTVNKWTFFHRAVIRYQKVLIACQQKL